MTNNVTPPKPTGTRRDFQESWRLLKANYRAFFGIEIFAIGFFVMIILALFAIEYLIDPNFLLNFPRDIIQSMNYRLIIIGIAGIILTIFINCQTGLAFDVMSSGEMFTEFRSAFGYFRQHWWKYILISFLMGGLGLSINVGGFPMATGHLDSEFPLDTLERLVIVLTTFGIGFLWQSLFVQSLASINAQGRFIRSIRESFRIFRANPKRVLSTWGLYYLLFVFPSFLFEVVLGLLNPPVDILRFCVVIFFPIYGLFVIFIGLPMRALLVTGLYNNIEFQRFPHRLTQPERNSEEKFG